MSNSLDRLQKEQVISGEMPYQRGQKEQDQFTADKELELQGVKGMQEMAKAQMDELYKRAAEGNLKPEHIFNKFEAASVPFITARDAHARVEESAKDPSAAGDLALIFNFMKVLDPGSTVREGEFATAESSRGIPAAIRNMYNKVIDGTRLEDYQRADFLNRSRRLFKGMEQQQAKTTDQFKKLAEKNGVSFENIIRDTGIAETQKGDNKKGDNKKGGVTVVRTGTLADGRKVQQMSDGSIQEIN
jgi:hypothetical protein